MNRGELGGTAGGEGQTPYPWKTLPESVWHPQMATPNPESGEDFTGKAEIILWQDLRTLSNQPLNVEAIRESPLHLGVALQKCGSSVWGLKLRSWSKMDHQGWLKGMSTQRAHPRRGFGPTEGEMHSSQNRSAKLGEIIRDRGEEIGVA